MCKSLKPCEQPLVAILCSEEYTFYLLLHNNDAKKIFFVASVMAYLTIELNTGTTISLGPKRYSGHLITVFLKDQLEHCGQSLHFS